MEKAVLSLDELSEYTGWGKTKLRALLKDPNSSFTIRYGNRLYANKKLFDEYLRECAENSINI